MKKYFISSDIHGFFTKWMLELTNKGFDINNKDHIIIICGDIIDRGKETDKIIDFLYDFPEDRRILIMGNHEELFCDMIYRGYPQSIDYSNGTYETYKLLYKKEEIFEISRFEKTKLSRLIDQMINFYETNNYVFVHGWIPLSENWRNENIDHWHNARWLNGIKQNIMGNNIPNKTIVCGHIPSIYGNLYKEYGKNAFIDSDKKIINHPELNTIYKNNGIICLDCNTFLTSHIEVLVLTEEEI